MKPREWIALGALLTGLAVGLGAFGAHALRETLEEAGRTHLWETAVRYQVWHGFAIVLCGLIQGRHAVGNLPAWLLLVGCLLFSGSVYGLALGAPSLVGAITPLGGLALLFGWGLLALRAARSGEGKRR